MPNDTLPNQVQIDFSMPEDSNANNYTHTHSQFDPMRMRIPFVCLHSIDEAKYFTMKMNSSFFPQILNQLRPSHTVQWCAPSEILPFNTDIIFALRILFVLVEHRMHCSSRHVKSSNIFIFYCFGIEKQRIGVVEKNYGHYVHRRRRRRRRIVIFWFFIFF